MEGSRSICRQHTRDLFRVTAANISAAYLSHLNRSTMPASERLWVRRSEGYDLKTQTGRDGALIFLIAMMENFRSGQAMIGHLQAICRRMWYLLERKLHRKVF